MTKKHISAFKTYSDQLKTRYKEGDATEHTYRPALQAFIEAFGDSIKATNEPGKKGRGNNTRNKPDFIIKKGAAPLGFIETKDLIVSIEDTEDTEQIDRYCEAYPNLIVTNYIQFRRYVRGELRAEVSIGKRTKSDISMDSAQGEELVKFFEDFLLEETFSVTSAAELADRLAGLTRQIRKLVKRELDSEAETARLHKLMLAFRKVLISDLDSDSFADMFAQTLAYGFFAAKVHYDGKGEFSRRTASSILPKTNPFLKKLFREFADDNLPESLVGAVDEIVDLLKKSDIKAILTEFGAQGKNDAVIHFYESFLGAFDPKLKKEMGVFYTPDPVVDYMVRSLDEILISKFGRKKGLADDKTLILDPALGTGSYLHKIIERIHSKVPKGAWDSYVSENLLDRIFGFEILMAPYSVAHLNLGLQLQKTGYSFDRDQRLGVFLTNTLEETAKRSEILFADWISEEADAAASIKRDKAIMVVTGNPPYAKESQNDGKWIRDLMRGYDNLNNKKCANYFECNGQPLGERNPKWLNDDYVKFIRFGHWRIEQTGHGVLGFITNHGYLDNPTFRGMRESLTKDFDEIYILDLHGNVKKKEKTESGGKDENVFDIQQGVSVCFMLRENSNSRTSDHRAKVYRADLFGTRSDKFSWLSENSFESTEFELVTPDAPAYLFTKQNKKLQKEYDAGISITEIFEVQGAGITTARDGFITDMRSDVLLKRVKDFKCFEGTDAELCEELAIPMKKGWDIPKSRRMMRETRNLEPHIVNVLYRPFDLRKMFYHDALVWRTVKKVMQPMIDQKNNLGLVFTRPMSPSYEFTAMATDTLIDQCAVGNKSAGAGISYLAPLYINNKSNLANSIQSLTEPIGNEEDIFYYIYATFYSPEYRKRYAPLLKSDFPKVQFTNDIKLAKKLSALGKELVQVHLLKDSRLEGGKSDFPIRGTNIVEKVRYSSKEQRVYINKSQYISNVPESCWSFDCGGYNVLEKWLKDRIGMKLTHADLSHYEKIVENFSLTQKIMEKIDQVIKASGGWPLAVKAEQQKKKAA